MNHQQRGYSPIQNNSNRSPNTSFQWGSPALSPSSKQNFSPHQNSGRSNGNNFVNSPSFRSNSNGNNFVNNSPSFNQGSSPRGHQNNNFCFRTPQPVPRHSSPQARWSGGDHKKHRFNNSTSPLKRFHNFKSPRYDPNCNPGGSNDIEQYYHHNMVQDPWHFLKPCPVQHAPVT